MGVATPNTHLGVVAAVTEKEADRGSIRMPTEQHKGGTETTFPEERSNSKSSSNTNRDFCMEQLWYMYHSLAKKGPWVEHLTSLPKRGVGALLTVSAFNHERVPTSCLQRLEALEAKLDTK